MELKDFKDVVRVMTKEEFESAINEDIKFERQEKESGFNFLYNPNNGRMRSGHIIIDGIGLFKQIIESGT